MYDFVVIGDVTIDHVLMVTDSTIVDSIDANKHTITLPFPSKLQLDQPALEICGGNAFNAASALAKLGQSTAIYTTVGKDASGQRITDELKQRGVDISLTQVDENTPTSNAFILSATGDRTVFSHHHPRTFSPPSIPDTKYVYLTSLGENDKPLFENILQQKQQKQFKLIFAPGTLQVREDFADVQPVLQQTDILILNKLEAKLLSRLNSESHDNLLHGLFKYGPKLIVLTRSSHGAIAFDGATMTKIGVLPVTPFDTTGAGDTFAATLGAMQSLGKDVETAMKYAAINAAHLIESIGTRELYTLDELEAAFKQNADKLAYVEPKVSVTEEGGDAPKPYYEHYGEEDAG